MPSLLLLLLLATLTPLTSVAEALETPKELHKHAIKLAQVEQLAESLPYFRAAVRAAPANVRYISDLGVTEMRLHDFEKAGMRFLEANYLSDGLYTNAVENMQELQSFMSSTEWSALELRWWSSRNFVSSPPDRQRHSVSPLPTITYASMLDPSNRTAANYLLGDHPYLLTGAMESWNLDNFAPSSLTDHFGASRVDYYPHNMQEESVHPFFTSLENALGNFDNPSGIYETVDASKRNTYIQWNVNYNDWEKFKSLGMDLPPMYSSDDDWINDCFDKEDDINKDNFLIRTHWRMMLIGQKGAGMFNHKDTLQSSSFQTQVAGRKRWHICHDRESKYLYKAGMVNGFAPDYDKYPEALKATCFDQIVGTGEMIYYPKNYWHQTRNLDDVTISVSGTLVTQENTAGITKEFRRECDTTQRVRIFQPETRLCEGLEKCFKIWREKSWEEDLAAKLEDVMRGGGAEEREL